MSNQKPKVTFCPFCGGDNIHHFMGTWRCRYEHCRSAFTARFQRTIRRTEKTGPRMKEGGK